MQPSPLRPNKILVVDDDTRIRDLLRRYLTQEGCDVLLAEDGKALTRIMMRETADLIVQSALRRKESRGLHYSRDFPQTDDVGHATVLIPPPR